MNVLATNNIGEEIMASPAIVDSKIYLRSDQHLYAFSEGARYTDRLVSNLNQQRESLDGVFRHDFSHDLFTKSRFHQASHTKPLKPEANGLRVFAPGADKWTSVGLNPEVALEGDFDVAVTLDMLKLERPAEGQSSAVYLRIAFDEASKQTANFLFIYQHDGRKYAQLRLQSVDSDGKTINNRIRHVGVKSLGGMRIARRGKRLYFLYKDKNPDPYRVLAQVDASVQKVLKRRIRLIVHTGGADRETEVLFKQLDIHADKVLFKE